MKCQRQGVRSTKVKIKVEPGLEEEEEQDGKGEDGNEDDNDIMITVYNTNKTMYTDQTGKFPTVSSRGNKYQMVLTHINLGSIWVEATKNKTEGEMILE